MDALMICLVAGALAAYGGRWFTLARALAPRAGVRSTAIAASGSALLGAIAAALLGGGIAAEIRGPGLLLFLALALVLAGAAMLWRDRPPTPRTVASARGPVTTAILLLAAMLGDSAPFIILAAAAWTGDVAFAMAGGAAGLLAIAAVASMPDLIPVDAALTVRFRQVSGALLILVGVCSGLVARGLI